MIKAFWMCAAAGLMLVMIAAPARADGSAEASPSMGAAAPAGATLAANWFQREMANLKIQFEKGGRTMWFLAFLSVMALAFLLERAFRLRSGAIAPKGLDAQANRMWKEGRYDDLRKLCESRPSTLSRIVRFLVDHRQASVTDLSTTAGDIGGRELRRHMSHNYPLAVVATLSPLLGLLGTVIGMIEAFEQVQVEGTLGNANELGGAISKALITTAAGLIVAVPALAFYHWFKARTSMYALELEEKTTGLINEWFVKETTDAHQA